jgi:hypothetical protein
MRRRGIKINFICKPNIKEDTIVKKPMANITGIICAQTAEKGSRIRGNGTFLISSRLTIIEEVPASVPL